VEVDILPCVAVAYIDSQNVRHKAIKSSNIICKGDEVLLTDFGSAHQFSVGLTSSTEGYAVGITKMYSALEVIALEAIAFSRRGRFADIYSLGCIFAEMYTVVCRRRIEDFHDFRSEPVPDEPDRMTLVYYATSLTS
jgi:serine/threonine protein kinase